MKTMEKGQDKIKKICKVLLEETLEPAQQQAQDILAQAQNQADQIIAEAKEQAEKLHQEAKAAIERERAVFKSSLSQAANQTLEALKQSIETKFFKDNLQTIIEKESADPQLIANLINAIVKAIEKDGLATNLTAIVPKIMSPTQVNALLMHEVLNLLKNNSVSLGGFVGGAQVKLQNKNLTIDISENALKELLSSYVVQRDFRKMMFQL